VHCLEQADQPQGAALADVAVRAGAAPRAVGDVLEVPGVVRTPAAWDGELYRAQDPPADPGRPVTLVARPYHQWGNRTVDAMRVWVPAE